MLGENIKEVLKDYSLVTHCGTFPKIQSTAQVKAHEELDELIEKANRCEELEKENRCLGIDIKNIKSERNRIIKQLEDTNKHLEKSNKQLKEDAEFGKYHRESLKTIGEGRSLVCIKNSDTKNISCEVWCDDGDFETAEYDLLQWGRHEKSDSILTPFEEATGVMPKESNQ